MPTRMSCAFLCKATREPEHKYACGSDMVFLQQPVTQVIVHVMLLAFSVAWQGGGRN